MSYHGAKGLFFGHSSRTRLFRGTHLIKRSIEHLTMSNSLDEGDHKQLSVEETTKKYGLEAGLFKAVTNRDGSEVKPGQLLKKYGAAYLITSITLAVISYAICYLLVSAGIDVASLLRKIGIEVSTGATNAGTAGIAYIIHKAASPIRFPPHRSPYTRGSECFRKVSSRRSGRSGRRGRSRGRVVVV